MVRFTAVLLAQWLVFVTALNHSEFDLEKLSKKIDAVLQQNKELVEENRKLKFHQGTKQARQTYGSTVAFTAQLTPDNFQVTGNQPIVYDKVVTNIENGYNSQTGMFTAPFSGIYHFSTTAMAVGNENVHIQLVKNGIEIARAYTSSTDFETGVAVVITELSKGDSIWVKHFSDSGITHLHGRGYTSFSGFLISLAE